MHVRRSARLWMVAALVAVACAAEERIETQILVLAETEACMRARGERPIPVMNAYQVALFRLDPAMDPGADEPPCRLCNVPGMCEEVDVRCGCGPPQALGTVGANAGLSGLRFPDLDPERLYCVGVSAFWVPEVRTTQTEECSCDFAGVNLAGRSRMCGLSPFPGSVAENAPAFILTMECNADCPTWE